jgi:diacylglycerol O-acyltransferase-1
MCFFRYYPRADKIRITYIIKQAAQLLFCLTVMYAMCMQYLDPVFRQTVLLDSDLKIAYLTLKVSLPWFLIWLLGSYAFFHCYLNILAEVTMFGDRLWYKDWWNAESFDKFWRLWNIPTHHFLLRHVYFQTIRLTWSKQAGVWMTFFFSAVIHELCMSIVFRTLRFYFFLAMVLQVPFVILAERLKTKSPRIGNMLMWMSLFTGQPLMLLMYFKVWYTSEKAMCDASLQVM